MAGSGKGAGGRWIPRCSPPKGSSQAKASPAAPERAAPGAVSNWSGIPTAVAIGVQRPGASKLSAMAPGSGSDGPKTVKSSIAMRPAATFTKELVLKKIAAKCHSRPDSTSLSGNSPSKNRHPSRSLLPPFWARLDELLPGPPNPPRDMLR